MKKQEIPYKVIEKRFRRRLKSKEKAHRRRKEYQNKLDQGFDFGAEIKYASKPLAPQNFTLAENQKGVLSFVSDLETLLNKGKSTFVRLNPISKIDLESITLLIGIMAEFQAAGVRFNGDFPNDDDSKKILIDSGFLKQLFPQNYGYSFGSKKGIYTHGNKIYDEDVTCEELSDALTCVFGQKRRSQGARRVLLEAMKNTIAHASPNRKRHWWLSFKKDVKNKKLTVSMLDYGIGIFTSLRTPSKDNPAFSWYEKTKNLGFKNRTILKKIMEGELKAVSRTREAKHGTGLPGMKTALGNNYISKLVIISNDVYADVGEDKYLKLDTDFSGTMVQFQICEKCKSFSYD